MAAYLIADVDVLDAEASTLRRPVARHRLLLSFRHDGKRGKDGALYSGKTY